MKNKGKFLLPTKAKWNNVPSLFSFAWMQPILLEFDSSNWILLTGIFTSERITWSKGRKLPVVASKQTVPRRTLNWLPFGFLVIFPPWFSKAPVALWAIPSPSLHCSTWQMLFSITCSQPQTCVHALVLCVCSDTVIQFLSSGRSALICPYISNVLKSYFEKKWSLLSWCLRQ